MVNGVYFPQQKLRFKLSDAQNRQFLEEDGCFGVVSKRQGAASSIIPYPPAEAKEPRAEFLDHHSVGVLVKIIDQPLIMRDYAEFSVEAVSRFVIKKVLTSDQIIKLCEVEMLDDAAEFAKVVSNATAEERKARESQILLAKTTAMKLMELYDKVEYDAKERPRGLMDKALKISKSAQEEPVKLLFLIAAVLRLPRSNINKSRKALQELLDINSFDERLKRVNELLASELARVTEVKTRAEKILQMDKEARGEAIRNMLKRKTGQTPGKALGEVEEIKKKLDECQLPQETQ